ncbi:unnamed protein product, partial [Meganyctiphanes norvegica]
KHHAWIASQQNFTVTTDPDIPWMAVDLGSGSSFQVVDDNIESSKLTVSWKPLPRYDHNGPNFGYRATLWQDDHKRIDTREVFTPYVTFHNISSDVDYRVEVVCINTVGSSNTSSE